MSDNSTSASLTNSSIVGESQATQRLIDLCSRYARSNVPILLVGPPGSEFEKIAAFIHQQSDRASQPFLRQRCVSWQDMTDPLRLVGAGTLFVDGIQHASLPVQLRLLSELDEARTLSRQGTADSALSLPPRLIASTCVNLRDLVASGIFLDDLYWQLCSLMLEVPTLKDRAADIPAMIEHMLGSGEIILTAGSTVRFDQQSIQHLLNYDWPGNYRQLQSLLQRSVVLAKDGELKFELLELMKSTYRSTESELNTVNPYAFQSTAVSARMLDSAEAAVAPNVMMHLAGVANAFGGGPHQTFDQSSTSSSGPQNLVGLKSLDLNKLIELLVERGVVEADRAHRDPHRFIVDRVEKALIAAVLIECENVQVKAATRLGINRNTLAKKIKDYHLE